MSVSFASGAHAVESASAALVAPISVIRILSPSNETYDSRFLTLTVTFPCAMGIRYTLTYSVDEKNEGLLPWDVVNSQEVHVVYEAIGGIELPALSDGTHSVTVDLTASGFITGQNPRSYSDTVCFAIDSDSPDESHSAPDLAPAIISNLAVENKTNFGSDVTLNFIVNGKASHVAYSLDGQDNVTIVGNTTLTGLSVGAHNLTVCAWDEAGNVGVSQAVTFVVSDPPSTQPPESLPVMPFFASIALATALAAGILVILKKRKRGGNSP